MAADTAVVTAHAREQALPCNVHVGRRRFVPGREGVIGIREAGDGRTSVTTKACEVVVVV